MKSLFLLINYSFIFYIGCCSNHVCDNDPTKNNCGGNCKVGQRVGTSTTCNCHDCVAGVYCPGYYSLWSYQIVIFY